MTITLLTLTPLLGALVVAVFARGDRTARSLSFVFNLIALCFVAVLGLRFDATSPVLQFKEQFQWIPSLNIEYFVGLDGLGFIMVLLAALVVPFAVLASPRIEDRPYAYYSLLLLLQAGLFGAFTALNF